ncbi:hypothetical protein Sjap_017944 [Stephania japonica]|uniref:Peripheral subunit-binding (PSBD) domain-containing protein n=1 Tax=Stephania japonica TaxID=461633 RepID=A0AAP0NKJ5_9MAGN
MVDLEGQDHGPSSSSVGDNDDDFIVYSKEGNNARWFKKEGDDVSAEDILCEVEIITNLHNSGDSKEAKVPSDPSPPTPPKKEDIEPVSLAEPKKPKVANAPQSGSRIFASPLARKLANDHNVPLSKIKGTGSDGTIVQADIEDYLAMPWTNLWWLFIQYHKGECCRANNMDSLFQLVRGADKKGLSKIADGVKSFTHKAKENSLKIEDYKGGTFTVSNLGGTYGIKQFCAIINPPQSGILAVRLARVAQSIQRLRREPVIHATLNDSFVVKSR